MGKKSKKKAKAGKAGALSPAGTAASADARCLNCRSTVRLSQGKGHQCPGCTLACCWRCEKKKFAECPNGDSCALPMRRCCNCYSGASLYIKLESSGWEMRRPGKFSRDDVEAFETVLGSPDGEFLSRRAIPFIGCHGPSGEGGCEDNVKECIDCFRSPKETQLNRCTLCGASQCSGCLGRGLMAPFMKLSGLTGEVDSTLSFVKDVMLETPRTMTQCFECDQFVCIGCASGEAMGRFAKNVSRFVATDFKDTGGGWGSFHCDSCYYANKPCTNPTCPNEVGVSTKRCGGCHISRYCSKECQAAAFPDHCAKCEKMQMKLAAKKADGLIESQLTTAKDIKIGQVSAASDSAQACSQREAKLAAMEGHLNQEAGASNAFPEDSEARAKREANLAALERQLADCEKQQREDDARKSHSLMMLQPTTEKDVEIGQVSADPHSAQARSLREAELASMERNLERAEEISSTLDEMIVELVYAYPFLNNERD